MNGHTGVEFIQWMRARKAYDEIPVVMFSGVALNGDKEEALASGGSVYDLVLKKGWLTKKKLDDVLSPANMTDPRQLPAEELV